jgi:hypothetical protein
MSREIAAARAQGASLVLGSNRAAELEAAYAGDLWEARQLGVPTRRGRGRANFSRISQPFLNRAVKRWGRWRLAAGCNVLGFNEVPGLRRLTLSGRLQQKYVKSG